MGRAVLLRLIDGAWEPVLQMDPPPRPSLVQAAMAMLVLVPVGLAWSRALAR